MSRALSSSLLLLGLLLPVRVGAVDTSSAHCPLPQFHLERPQDLFNEQTGRIDRGVNRRNEKIRRAFVTALNDDASSRDVTSSAKTIRRQAMRGSAFAMARYAVLSLAEPYANREPAAYLAWLLRAQEHDPMQAVVASLIISMYPDGPFEVDPVALLSRSRVLCEAGAPEGCMISAYHAVQQLGRPLSPFCVLQQAEFAFEHLQEDPFARLILIGAHLRGGDGPVDTEAIEALLASPDLPDDAGVATLRLRAAAGGGDAERATAAAQELWQRALQGDASALYFWYQTVKPNDVARHSQIALDGDARAIVDRAVSAAAAGDRLSALFLMRCQAGGKWCSDVLKPDDLRAWRWLMEHHDPVLRSAAALVMALSVERDAQLDSESEQQVDDAIRLAAESGVPSAMLYHGVRLRESGEATSKAEGLAWYLAGHRRALLYGMPALPIPYDRTSPLLRGLEHRSSELEQELSDESDLSDAERLEIERRASEIELRSHHEWSATEAWLRSYREAYGS